MEGAPQYQPSEEEITKGEEIVNANAEAIVSKLENISEIRDSKDISFEFSEGEEEGEEKEYLFVGVENQGVKLNLAITKDKETGEISGVIEGHPGIILETGAAKKIHKNFSELA